MGEEIITPEEETFAYDKLRYILDKNGYVCHASIGGLIVCDLGECTEYTGEIPNGYSTIEEWYDGEFEKLNAWKIVDNNLVFDEAQYNELINQFNQEAENNRVLTKRDLFEIDEKVKQNDNSLKEQYETKIAKGKIVETTNTNPLSPNIKISNINCYLFPKINLIASNRNLLLNTATSNTIEGITFTQNVDRSIALNGTSSEDIEYDIARTNTNVSPILVLKKNTNYYLTSNDFQIKMYNFDGIDREEVYSGKGGIINTSEDKVVTHVVLAIPKGTKIDNVTIYPQLELGINPSEYIQHREHTFEFDYSSLIDETLFPNADLYPVETLFPKGTIIDYIDIRNNEIYVCKDGKEVYLKEGYLSVLSGIDYIYSIQDTNLEVTYYTDVLKIDNLDFLCGKETTNKKFKVLEDASIQVNNIYMYDGAKVIGGDGLLTNLQFSSNTQPIGQIQTSYNGLSINKGRLEFNVYIPPNFTVTSAIVNVMVFKTENHYATSNGAISNLGAVQNIRLYKEMDAESYVYASYSGTFEAEHSLAEIEGAFGENGYTNTKYDYDSFSSIDIAEELNEVGKTTIVITTDDEVLDSSIDANVILASKQSQVAYGTIDILGYISNYKEGDK